MTETGFGEFHNGGSAEMPPAEPVAKRGRKTRANTAAGDGAPKTPRLRGAWVGWNDIGEWQLFGSEVDASRFALLTTEDNAKADRPPSVEFVQYETPPSR